MPTLNLEKLFYPRSVAVVGASNREGTAGNVVMHNLLHGGFEGPILPVGPDRAIAGVLAYSKVDDLPITPDLAVVCTPPLASIETIRMLGKRGTRAAILLSHDEARKGVGRPASPTDLVATLRHEAESSGVRLLGPGCLGVIVPGIGLNASTAHIPAQPGAVAFVSQSSTICAAVLDWASQRDIGFSHFLSLGKTADICFGDVIDYLGNDAMTRAILLYVESIQNGRSFMSAGRGASRNKPILVIKAGRTPEGQLAAFGDTSAEGADDVYDAVIRRAGMLRVFGFNELFSAVETLARAKPLRGERLAIVSNGRGMGVMAVDSLVLNGGKLASFAEPTVAALDKLLPPGRDSRNPVDFDEEAPPERYGAVIRTLFEDPGVDAVMVLHAPVAGVSSSKAAEAVIQANKEKKGCVLTSWMGGSRVEEARHLFGNAKIPTFDTPNQAIDSYLHMVGYRRNQEMLIETPTSAPEEFTPDSDAARLMVNDYLEHGRNFLVGHEALSLLAAYGIASAKARVANSPAEAAAQAQQMGFPVALRRAARATAAAGEGTAGVGLALDSPAEVQRAAEELARMPGGQERRGGVRAFIVERMARFPGTHELMIRVNDDPVFGPVITFGHGGLASDLIRDHAVALPPLNTSLARELISRTRVHRLLQGYGECPAANIEALCLTLIKVSQMIIELPEMAALEINPLLIDEQGVYALDAQILIAPPTEKSERRLAIRPYPKELEEEFRMPNGQTVLLRPIRPEDEPAHHDFIARCAPDDLRLRFFHLVRRLPHSEMARLTQIDYDREMAFVAVMPSSDGSGTETLGVVRTITDLHNDKAEYAVLVRSDLKGQRLGWKLMEKIIRYSRSRGTRRIIGLVLIDNRKMLGLVHRLGFTSRRVPDDDTMEVELDLQPPSPAEPALDPA